MDDDGVACAGAKLFVLLLHQASSIWLARRRRLLSRFECSMRFCKLNLEPCPRSIGVADIQVWLERMLFVVELSCFCWSVLRRVLRTCSHFRGEVTMSTGVCRGRESGHFLSSFSWLGVKDTRERGHGLRYFHRECSYPKKTYFRHRTSAGYRLLDRKYGRPKDSEAKYCSTDGHYNSVGIREVLPCPWRGVRFELHMRGSVRERSVECRPDTSGQGHSVVSQQVHIQKPQFQPSTYFGKK